MAYGPSGAKGYAQAYNPRTGTYASTRQGSNPYGNWGSSHVQRGDDWVNTQRVTDNNGNSKWAAQGSGGGQAKGIRHSEGGAFVGEKNGDVYAGRDGNVYRKTEGGGWQSYDNGGWNDVQGGNRPGNQPANGAGNRPGTGGAGASQLPAGSGGAAGTRPSTQPGASTRPAPNPNTMGQLNKDAAGRSQGTQRTQSQYGGSSSRGSSSASRGSYGGSRGGSRGGGGGRRR
jgi:hypothetical protein